MALGSYLSDFLKLVIFRLSLSNFSNISLSALEVIKFLRLNNMIMFAFSKVDLLAIFKNDPFLLRYALCAMRRRSSAP